MENKLSSLIRNNFEENFLDFDLTEIQTVLADLKNENPMYSLKKSNFKNLR